MIYKSRAIVLSQIKFGESSQIVKMYTEAYGIQSFIYNQSRKKGAKTHTTPFQHLALIDLVAYKSNHASLQRIKENKSNYHFKTIPFDIKKSSITLFVNEVLCRSLSEDEPHKDLFNYINDSIVLLDEIENKYSDFHLFFLLGLSKLLGFAPLNNFSDENIYFNIQEGCFQKTKPEGVFLNESQGELLNNCLKIDFPSVEFKNHIPLGYSDLQELIEALLVYFQLHVSGFRNINSFHVLGEIFN